MQKLKTKSIKQLTLIFFLMLSVNLGFAQNPKFSTYWNQRASLFEKLPINKKDIVFVGNSITDGGEWFELLNHKNVKNRGISGDVAHGILERIDEITKGRPKKIFLMIGINDLSAGRSIDTIAQRTERVVKTIKKQSPKTKIYLQSVLPVSTEKKMFGGHTARRKDIAPLNMLLKVIAREQGATYIDLYSHFINPSTGMLDLKYSNDGLHLLGEGYIHWAKIIKDYIK